MIVMVWLLINGWKNSVFVFCVVWFRIKLMFVLVLLIMESGLIVSGWMLRFFIRWLVELKDSLLMFKVLFSVFRFIL